MADREKYRAAEALREPVLSPVDRVSEMLFGLFMALTGPRTGVYGGEREFQRGPFAQVTWGRFTIGGFWFNPGSNDQVFVGSVRATF